MNEIINNAAIIGLITVIIKEIFQFIKKNNISKDIDNLKNQVQHILDVLRKIDEETQQKKKRIKEMQKSLTSYLLLIEDNNIRKFINTKSESFINLIEDILKNDLNKNNWIIIEEKIKTNFEYVRQRGLELCKEFTLVFYEEYSKDIEYFINHVKEIIFDNISNSKKKRLYNLAILFHEQFLAKITKIYYKMNNLK